MTGLSVGTGLAGIGGWVAERHGWSAAFDVFGIFGVVYAVGLLFVLREPPRQSGVVTSSADQPRLGQALVSLFSSRSFLLLLAFWGLLALAGWAVMGWMPTFFKEQFKLDQGAAGISATSFLAVAMFVGKLVGGAWADRWSRTNDRARILVPAIGLFIATPATLLVANTGVLAMAIAGLSIYGFTRVFSDANLMPILCQVSDSRYRATGYGVLNMFSCIVGGLTVYIGGVLRDAQISVSTLFQFAAGGLLVCGALMVFVKPVRSTGS
jgi:sugar phosphate permease